MIIRPEHPVDIASIRRLISAAFAPVVHSSQTEGAIVDALRAAGALTLSLVAERDGLIIGHAGFSPVLIDGEDAGWFGLGPVSVSPDDQRSGVGSALIRTGLDVLANRGAQGCVVFGNPGFYGRFGFVSDPDLRYSGGPARYFHALVLGEPAAGEVTYHAGFDAT
jgi:putative acetyltransferase